jgi:chromosome partitioning protein
VSARIVLIRLAVARSDGTWSGAGATYYVGCLQLGEVAFISFWTTARCDSVPRSALRFRRRAACGKDLCSSFQMYDRVRIDARLGILTLNHGTPTLGFGARRVSRVPSLTPSSPLTCNQRGSRRRGTSVEDEEPTMAVCVSMINMKGGVGKTTLASQIAWYATMLLDKKVLLIDLDPQANASQSVMSPQTYVSYLDNGGLTVHDIFEQFTPTGTASGSPRKLDPLKAIHSRVEYSDGSLLHIVPSRLELSWTLRNPTGKETLLPRFVAKLESKYDLIIIDCSPTDSILTDAAYHCSRYVLVPIRAEFLASIGFPLLNRSIKAFQIRHEESTIEVCGLVFNDFIRGNVKSENKLARKDVMDGSEQEFDWLPYAALIRKRHALA